MPWRSVYQIAGRVRRTRRRPLTLSTTLPLMKYEYNSTLQHINELRVRISEAKRMVVTVTGPAAPPSTPDLTAQLKKLAELQAAGILTDEEFATKKAEFHDRL
jgi:hypothetical protein